MTLRIRSYIWRVSQSDREGRTASRTEVVCVDLTFILERQWEESPANKVVVKGWVRQKRVRHLPDPSPVSAGARAR
jgi:hypothetical protein